VEVDGSLLHVLDGGVLLLLGAPLHTATAICGGQCCDLEFWYIIAPLWVSSTVSKQEFWRCFSGAPCKQQQQQQQQQEQEQQQQQQFAAVSDLALNAGTSLSHNGCPHELSKNVGGPSQEPPEA
jgi:hypothetical protein